MKSPHKITYIMEKKTKTLISDPAIKSQMKDITKNKRYRRINPEIDISDSLLTLKNLVDLIRKTD